MSKISFFIHTSIAAEVAEALPSSVKPWIKTFEATEKTTFQNPQIQWQSEDQYCVFILPGEWTKSKWALPTEAALKCIQGTLRIVFWRAETHPEWSVPLTWIPKNLQPELTLLVLHHVCRPSSWGLHTVLPVGAEIFTERVRSDKQMKEKIDQIANLVAAMKTGPEIESETLKLYLKDLLAAAPSGFTFQMGLHERFIACSVRWKSESIEVKQWLKPKDKWQSLFAESQMSIVQMNDGSKQTEILFVLASSDDHASTGSTPVIIDVLTSNRLKVAAALEDKAKEFKFEYFENKKLIAKMEQHLGKV